MFAVIIHEKGGQPRRQEFTKSEVTIGRVQGNDIILPKQNVSKRHSRIVVKDGKFIIVDLKSTNGTYVNGRKIASPMVIKQSDKIYIGDFILAVEPLEAEDDAPPPPSLRPAAPKAAPPPPPRPKPAPAPLAPRPAPPAPAPVPIPAAPAPLASPPALQSRPAAVPAPPPPVVAPAPAPAPVVQAATPIPPPVSDALGAAMGEVFVKVHGYVTQQRLSLPESWSPGEEEDAGLHKRLEGVARDAVRGVDLPAGTDQRTVIDGVISELLGGGPLTALLGDTSIERIYSNGSAGIFAVRGGATSEAGRFSSAAGATLVADRLLAGAGVSSGGAFAEGYLADGTRVHVAYSTVGGPAFTLTRPRMAPALSAMVEADVLSANMAAFLAQAVASGRKVVIASNDVDVRFELIGALLGQGAAGLRIVAVEGGARLPAGSGQVQIAGAHGLSHSDLVRQAVKMRPDRLVLADARGAETYVALTSISGAINGGILGIDAESTDDAMIRLVRQTSLALGSADDKAVDALVRESVDVLVQLLRYADGRVSVTQIIDVDGEVQEVFNGLGGFRATGHVPRWVSNAQSLGHDIDLNMFR